MVNYTRANADLLKKIGISVGSDNKLTVDEDKLKASDMAVVKSVFKDSGSFGQTISAKASTIYGNAVYSYQNYLLRILIHLMDCIHTHLVIHITSTHN